MPTQTWFENQIQTLLPDLPLTSQQFSALYNHFILLLRWNERMDLTSVDSREEIVRRHYCESLFFAHNLPDIRPGLTLLDFGSGAGFPGYPLAVLRPDWRVTLLDANQRRAVFLKECARDLHNVTVSAERGELYSAKHDWLVARAVKNTEILACIPRLADHVGLLVGEESLQDLRDASNCEWAQAIHIPWVLSRCCAFAQCST